MWFINNIVSLFNNIASWFYQAYLKCYYAYYIPTTVAMVFYYLSFRVSDLAWAFYYFGQWVDGVRDALLSILNWEAIKWYIRSWLPNLDDINSWFYNWWGNVTSAITSWWSSTQYTVQGWIDIAKSYLQSQINSLSSLVASLQSQISYLLDQLPSINEIIAWFSDWWAFVLAQIIAWGALRASEIASLIDSAIRAYAPFWEGWQDWRDAVIEFFTDPEDWLYKAVDRIIERFW